MFKKVRNEADLERYETCRADGARIKQDGVTIYVHNKRRKTDNEHVTKIVN